MRALTEKEVEGFLEEAGIDSIYSENVKSIEEARKRLANFSFPIVLKASSKAHGAQSSGRGAGGAGLGAGSSERTEDSLDKPEPSIVRIVRNKEEFTKRFNGLLEEIKERKMKCDGVTMREFVDGVELVLGLRKDPTFGYALMFGFGGEFAETHRDRTYRVCPINDRDAGKMIDELKAKNILFDGNKNLDLEKLRKALMKLSKAPQKKRGLNEIVISPLVMNENGLKAVNSRIIFD